MLSTSHFLCQHHSHCILLGGIRINDESFDRIGISAEDGIRNDCLDLCESCILLFSPDERYILLSKFSDGLEDFGMVGNMVLDEVYPAKETLTFLTL